MNEKRGSIWRKWDLHVHTPCSIQQGYGGDQPDIWEKYISDLENLPSEIQVLGINDYIFIDGYRKVLEFKNQGRLQNIKLILPVIELRINRFGNLGKSDPWSRINLHIIFSDQVTPDIIQAQFLNAIQNSYQLSPDFQDFWGGVISKESLIDFGEKIKETANVEIPESSLKVGFNNLNFKEEEVFDKLNNTHYFTHKHLTALGKTEWDQLRWDGSAAEKKDIINKVNFVFTASESVENYMNAKEKLRARGVNSLLLDCSDSHHFSDSSNKDRIGNTLTWIKADPTFEGLKQIIYEPELRLMVGANPSRLFPKLKISGLKIQNSNNFHLVDQEVPFNSDLVSIVGGRGSGKSALLETLTFCFGKNKSAGDTSQIYTEDYSSGSDYINYFKKRGGDAEIKLFYSDLDNESLPEFTTSIQNNEEDCDYPLLYLGQNQIEDFASKSKKIHDLAFEAVVMNSTLTDEIGSLQNEIKALEAELISTTKEIEASRLQLKAYNIDKVKAEKQRIEKEIKLLSSKETKEIIEKLTASRKKKDKYTKAKKLTEELIARTERTTGNLNKDAHELNQILPLIGIEDVEVNFDLSSNLSALDTLIQRLEDLPIIEEHDKNMAEAEKQLEGKTEISASYFDSLKSRLEEMDKQIESYKKDKEFLDKSISWRYEHLDDFAEIFTELDTLYTEAIKKFEESHSGILKSLRLKSEVGFAHKQMIRNLFEKVDRRRVKDIDKFASEILKITEKLEGDFEYSEWIKEFESMPENYSFFYDDGLKTFEEIVYSNYNYLNTVISYEVEENNYRPLNMLSLGQKGTVLLKLYLSVGSNCPIIIDQPEDHLDNHFIYTDLVTTLRNAKLKRQIILVTHDANIVVNGDSDQVIIAEFNNNTINYELSGALENDLIKNSVARILEGGDEAFIKRERKYQFSR